MFRKRFGDEVPLIRISREGASSGIRDTNVLGGSGRLFVLIRVQIRRGRISDPPFDCLT